MRELKGLYQTFGNACENVQTMILKSKTKLEEIDKKIACYEVMEVNVKRNIAILDNSNIFLNKKKKEIGRELILEFKFFIFFFGFLELGVGIVLSLFWRSIKPFWTVIELGIKYHYGPMLLFFGGRFFWKYREVLSSVRNVQALEDKFSEEEKLEQISLEKKSLLEERKKEEVKLKELESINVPIKVRIEELNEILDALVAREEFGVNEENKMSR